MIPNLDFIKAYVIAEGWEILNLQYCDGIYHFGLIYGALEVHRVDFGQHLECLSMTLE